MEAVATARALAFARATDSPVHVVHLSSAAALDEVRRAQGGRRPRLGRDLPALPGPHRRALRRARSGPLRLLRHLAAAPLRRRPRRLVGRARRRVARPRRHGPCPRPRRRREGRGRRGRFVRPDQQRRPGIETLLTLVYSEGVATRAHHARADGRPAGDDTRRAVRARAEGRARGRPRRGHRRLRSRRATDDHAPPSSTTRATTRRTRGST